MNEKNQKKTLNLVNDFSKIWKFSKDDDEVIEEPMVGYMDSANVMMVIPKRIWIKKIIEDNFAVSPSRAPKLDYLVHTIGEDKMKVIARITGGKEEHEDNKCRISTNYLKIALQLCTNTKSGGVTIKVKRDYPIWLETKEMIVIIAPRIDEESL